MISFYKYYFLAFLLSLSCDNRKWNNPFDPDCPKEIFTPDDFTAIQQGSEIKLDWALNNSNISGFTIYKNSNNGTWVVLANPDIQITSYTDGSISGGIKYGYKLIALAGSNQSNEVIAYCTPILGAILTTKSASVNTLTSANSGGIISDDGGSPVTARGICWSTSHNPTISNSKTIDGTGAGDFSSNLTGLQSGKTYYVRAYATNSFGTEYGNEIRFPFYLNVPGPTITDADGNTYKSIRIGDQIWMAENLKTTKYRDGTAIPYVTDKATWAELTTGAYCYFSNSTSNGSVYGGLYNFYAVVDNRGLCPSGWHVPSDSEWSTLRDYLGGEDVAGGRLKETGTDHWNEPNIGADNSTGFAALAGSWRGESGSYYYNVGRSAYWWTSTEVDPDNAWNYNINYNSASLNSHYGTYHRKKAGHSIRCIKD